MLRLLLRIYTDLITEAHCDDTGLICTFISLQVSSLRLLGWFFHILRRYVPRKFKRFDRICCDNEEQLSSLWRDVQFWTVVFLLQSSLSQSNHLHRYHHSLLCHCTFLFLWRVSFPNSQRHQYFDWIKTWMVRDAFGLEALIVTSAWWMMDSIGTWLLWTFSGEITVDHVG